MQRSQNIVVSRYDEKKLTARENLVELQMITISMLEAKLEILKRQLNNFEAIQSHLEELDESEIEGAHQANFEGCDFIVESAINKKLAEIL
ncbi:unnamed protein product [Ceratitis capitata]|uniref:(Mediterranean fruit fly) hypothetical protein n=1 Tax=Ceratitis capitata TaxID=7213 RepID=A0A811UTF9_CERCA|nr:unnamed protein product [Ceratitis capitata]